MSVDGNGLCLGSHALRNACASFSDLVFFSYLRNDSGFGSWNILFLFGFLSKSKDSL